MDVNALLNLKSKCVMLARAVAFHLIKRGLGLGGPMSIVACLPFLKYCPVCARAAD